MGAGRAGGRHHLRGDPCHSGRAVTPIRRTPLRTAAVAGVEPVVSLRGVAPKSRRGPGHSVLHVRIEERRRPWSVEWEPVVIGRGLRGWLVHGAV